MKAKAFRAYINQRKRWEDDIREWTGLEFDKSKRAMENREKRRKLVAKSSVVPPSTLSVKGLMMMMMMSLFVFPCGSTGTFSGNCQETETCMVRAYHTPRQPLQNHPSGHLGGWATPCLAEEMLDGRHQRVDIPAHARTADNGLLQTQLEEDLC